MPYCPTCRSEYRPGFDTCAECRVALVEELPPDTETDEATPDVDSIEWRRVYAGPAAVVEQVEAYLEASTLPFTRFPARQAETDAAEQEQPQEELWIVAVPEEVYDRFRDRVQHAVLAGARAGGDTSVDQPVEPEDHAEAMAQAEEDSAVLGCTECRFFFSSDYEVCPGCDVDLVPAVEIFEPDQLEPDRVIVADGDGPAVDALTLVLKDAGFDAQSFEVEGWSFSAVDLPWNELCDRTSEAVAIIDAHTAAE